MPVRQFQRKIQDRIEAQPVQFYVRELEKELDDARSAVATFVGAKAQDVVFVPNATSGINTVLRSLKFAPRDELLVTDHEYNACRNALEFVAARSGAKVVVAPIPFPLRSADEVIDAVLERVSSRTRLALLDHVTSQTALILPLPELVKELSARGVETLIDGAHAPGMIPLNLRQLGATYYTGNCHKWICAPKSSGFLHVQRDRQPSIHPLAISHGANSPRKDRSRFQIEFGWTGTWDASAMLSVPEALRVMEKKVDGGWPELMRRNHELALEGRNVLCSALGMTHPCPDDMIGSMASLPLPDSAKVSLPSSPLYADPLQDELRERFHIEVPIIPWPRPPGRLLRISAQQYNKPRDYRRLAEALRTLGAG